MNLHSISTFKSPPSLHITASGHMIIVPITELFKHCISLRYMQIKPTITSVMVWSPSVVTTVFFTLTLLYLRKICLRILIARGTELYQRELESVGLISWFTCKIIENLLQVKQMHFPEQLGIVLVLIHKFANSSNYCFHTFFTERMQYFLSCATCHCMWRLLPSKPDG